MSQDLSNLRATRRPMDPNKSRRMLSAFEKADDLFTTCRGCGKVRRGTMQELREECDCGTASNGEAGAPAAPTR